MADSLVQNLTKRVINSLASITGVMLWSGKTGESDALGVELSEFVNSDVVVEGSAIDYQALTPKGFGASVATETRKGIVEKATAAEMTAGTAEKYPDSAQVKGADDDVKTLIGLRGRVHGTCDNTGSASKAWGDLSISGSKLGTGRYRITHNMGSSAYFVVLNTVTTESIPLLNKIGGLWRGTNSFVVSLGDDASANDGWFEFTIIQYGI